MFAYKNSHTWGWPDTISGRGVCWEKYELESGRAARGKILHLWITQQCYVVATNPLDCLIKNSFAQVCDQGSSVWKRVKGIFNRKLS